MIAAKVIQVFYKDSQASKKIYGYKIQDTTGDIKDVTSEQLKTAIKNGKITLSNYKLTSDNRLIKTKEKNIHFINENYLLLNKDIIIAKFDLYFGNIEIQGKMPYDYTNINEWINIRARFSCAHDVKEFFKTIGINSAEDIIEITHCVSLHDTFWIKKTDSKLKWKNISPYSHNYSEIISIYALEGINIGNADKNYFSPVLSTDGSFPHTWKFNNTGIKFIKASSKYTLGGTNSGREPYSEYYASEIAEYLGFNHVKYNIRNHKRHDNKLDIVTECNCFTTEKIGTVTAHNLGLSSYENVLMYCKKLSGNAFNTCLDMYFLDSLLLNTDRHFSNIEFFVNNDTLDIIDIAPIFDNNYSLLPRFIEGYDIFNRKDYITRDNISFEDLYLMVKIYKSYRDKLISIKKFKFIRPQNVKISVKRLQFLNELLQIQVNYLLKF